MKKNRHIERVGRIIGSMMLLFCTVTLISCSQESNKIISEKEDMKSGFTENKERNRKEGILYMVDDTKKRPRRLKTAKYM